MEYSCTHRRLCTDQLTDQLYILYHSRMEKSTVDYQKPTGLSESKKKVLLSVFKQPNLLTFQYAANFAMHGYCINVFRV